jgi:predicted ATPase
LTESGRRAAAVSSVLTEPVIRTPDQRLRVFVSSTLSELAAERVAVRAAIEQLHLIPVMFDLGARAHPPRALYRSYLAQSQVFVGIYWQRYGWIAPGEVFSGLEDEYGLADGMPRLLYVKEPAPEQEARLTKLIGRFERDDRASYTSFRSPDELTRLVRDDLAVLLSERFDVAARMAGPGPEPAGRSSTVPPVPLTETIGRNDAIGEVAAMLRTGVRLVTITGPGGTGKSRLALEVARRIRPRVEHGVHFVGLEPLVDASGFLRLVADRLGVLGEARRPLLDTLADHLEDRTTVLLIDNFEHVATAATDLAALLDRSPGVQALVTSRSPLRLRGEREYPLPPLAVPRRGARDAAGTAAVELFVQRARAVRPDFTLTDLTLPAVAELVRRLDGLPLAIELAAARTRLLPPDRLLERLDERLDVLSSGAVDLPPRQRTLRATIGWSYGLLSPDEQRLFDRLGIFAGGATLDAVAEVCADRSDPDVLEVVSSLLEKSLLLSTTETGGEPRINLLNTVRAYARERLAERGETAAIADRHADWFLARTAMVAPDDQARAHERFDDLLRESDDVRAAMRWVLERGDVKRVAAFAHTTWMWFWMTGRVTDARPWFEAALELVTTQDVKPATRAAVLYSLGQLRQIYGDAEGSADLLEPAIELLRASGAEAVVAGALIALAAGAPLRGHPEQVLEHARTALEIGERLGEDYIVIFAAANVGTALMIDGDLPGARAAQEHSLAAAVRCRFELLEAQALSQLAIIDALEDDLDAAWSKLRGAAGRLRRTHNREGAGYWLEAAGLASLRGGEPGAALRALLTADSVRRELSMTIWPQLQPNHARWCEQAQKQLGPEEAQVHHLATVQPDPWRLLDELVAGAPS